MSFRNRLTLFFALIVLAPMGVLAVVVVTLIDRSQDTMQDARIEQAQRTASGVYRLEQERANAAGEAIGGDVELAQAIRRGEREAIAARLEELRQIHGVAAVRLSLAGSSDFVVGLADLAVAPAERHLLAGTRQVGELEVAAVSSAEYAAAARALTGMDLQIARPRGRPLAAVPSALLRESLPAGGKWTIDDQRYHISSFTAPAVGGGRVTIRLVASDAFFDDEVPDAAVAAAIALVGFLALALAFAVLLSRSLHAQVSGLLQAARRLGAGDFDVEVPTAGNDEFAQLGSEFNAMARQLQARLGELQQERARLSGAIRRVGASFATGLDRDALLALAVETAVDGLAADAGRTSVHSGSDGALRPVAAVGAEDPGLADCLRAAESACVRAAEAVELEAEGVAALAHPLRTEPHGPLVGVLALARSGRPFTEEERELLAYLALQTGVSIENAELHEAVQRQAVTDELTGLNNHRRFQEVLETEVERSRRFKTGVALVLLDLDNFKRVNDTYGHRQGDEVLRQVADVLRRSVREIDVPARYGGEELAVVLPQTGTEGAARLAERVRVAIEALEIPLLEGEGTLQVTASFGVATLTGEQGADQDALVAAADAALYRAKRAGKNRVVTAV
jgi:diguanylate cyclase (GGDEF)-like protein